MKDLANHHELHLISLSDEEVSDQSIETIKAITESIKIIKISRKSALSRTAKALISKKPFQVHYFFSRKVNFEVNQTIDQIQPDVIYCQLIRMSEYVRYRKEPKVLDYMDCFSMNYLKRQNFESFPARLISSQEAKRLRSYEREVAANFDRLTIISERDKNEIDASSEIIVISNGIDIDYFHPINKEMNCDILFVGNMGYHPNVLAAEFIAREIKPALRTNYRIRIAGARPTNRVKKLNRKGIEVTGWIEDIREAYAGAEIFVAPIFSGAGQQNKILEAMAMEKICITTSNVNDAIGANHGQHLFIADSAAEFALRITEVLQNKKKYKEIKENARQFVLQHFSWKKENNKLNELIIKAGKEK